MHIICMYFDFWNFYVFFNSEKDVVNEKKNQNKNFRVEQKFLNISGNLLNT